MIKDQYQLGNTSLNRIEAKFDRSDKVVWQRGEEKSKEKRDQDFQLSDNTLITWVTHINYLDPASPVKKWLGGVYDFYSLNLLIVYGDGLKDKSGKNDFTGEVITIHFNLCLENRGKDIHFYC